MITVLSASNDIINLFRTCSWADLFFGFSGLELNAMKTLIKELGKGETSAKDGWISLDEVEKRLGL